MVPAHVRRHHPPRLVPAADTHGTEPGRSAPVPRPSGRRDRREGRRVTMRLTDQEGVPQ
ncbi:hypothetical protein SFR_5150 [Streptomyces sp. FR-008]|nr:hypothetical protein SFR_5150 [Streptomyces sp. FR-008]